MPYVSKMQFLIVKIVRTFILATGPCMVTIEMRVLRPLVREWGGSIESAVTDGWHSMVLQVGRLAGD